MNKLLEQAISARQKSHSPYSKFKVGSAVLFENGQIYSGSNIENASYGGTVCAERVAIWNGISSHGEMKIKEILVVTDSEKAWPPCGMCRQVIAEFATDDTLIHTANLQGVQRTYKLSEILPDNFSSDFLKK